MKILDKVIVGIRTRRSIVQTRDDKNGSGEEDMGMHSEGGPMDLKFIPYFAWANRGPSDMRVWVARAQENMCRSSKDITAKSRLL